LTNAETYYQKIITLDPKKIDWIVKGYSSLGVIYHKRKEYIKARNFYNTVLKFDAKNTNATKAVEALTRIIDELEVKRQLGE
jgi:tetratricopeptide (TPR) repeat protein